MMKIQGEIMSQIIVGPNDVYFVEVADIRNMAEKNGVKKAVEMLDKTGATFVKFIFEETTNGFIEPRQEFLNEKKQVIEGIKMPFHVNDMLSFISKFENVEKIQGAPLSEERNVRSVVKMDYDTFHDGDVFHLPYKDFIKGLKNVASEDYFEKYAEMKDYGIENIFFSFHYQDNRSSSTNNLYGFYKDEQGAIINPYYEMVFDIWATDSQGSYFFDGVDKARKGQSSEDAISESIRRMKKEAAEYSVDEKRYERVSGSYARLGHKNMEKFFNNYEFVEHLNYVDRVRSKEKSFISVSDMTKVISKIIGPKQTVQDGDSYNIKTNDLSLELKEKYDIPEEAKVIIVEAKANEADSRYLELKASYHDWGHQIGERNLLKGELQELLDHLKDASVLFHSSKETVEVKKSSQSLSDEIKDVDFEKTYLVNIDNLKSLNNQKLNKELEKLQALGEVEVLVGLKIDLPYKLNGKKEAPNTDFKFNPHQFPELDIYAFNNKTGKGYDPEILKNISLKSIFNDEENARALLDMSRDDIFPQNNKELKSAALSSLEAGAIFNLLKNGNPLTNSGYGGGYFTEKTELNLYMVSMIGRDRVMELGENSSNNIEASRPKIR